MKKEREFQTQDKKHARELFEKEYCSTCDYTHAHSTCTCKRGEVIDCTYKGNVYTSDSLIHGKARDLKKYKCVCSEYKPTRNAMILTLSPQKGTGFVYNARSQFVEAICKRYCTCYNKWCDGAEKMHHTTQGEMDYIECTCTNCLPNSKGRIIIAQRLLEQAGG